LHGKFKDGKVSSFERIKYVSKYCLCRMLSLPKVAMIKYSRHHIVLRGQTTFSLCVGLRKKGKKPDPAQKEKAVWPCKLGVIRPLRSILRKVENGFVVCEYEPYICFRTVLAS